MASTVGEAVRNSGSESVLGLDLEPALELELEPALELDLEPASELDLEPALGLAVLAAGAVLPEAAWIGMAAQPANRPTAKSTDTG